MNPKTLSIFLLLLAIALAGYWFVNHELDRPLATDHADDLQGSIPMDIDSHNTISTSKRGELRRDTESQKAVAPATIQQGRELEVKIVNLSAPGTTLPPTTVYWQVVPRGETTPDALYDSQLLASPDQSSSGETGSFLLERPLEQDIEFLVKSGDLCGRGRYRSAWKPDAALVPVYLDRSLRVQVLHHDGSPAPGIRVSFAGIRPRTGKSTEWAFAHSNIDGVAVIPHMQLHDPHPQSMGGDDIPAVIACIASATPPMQRFEVGQSPPNEMELHLPPLGFAEVHALRADGNSFPDGQEVSLQGSRPGSPGTGSMGYAFLRLEPVRGLETRPLKDGAAVFPVALGEELEYGLHLQDHQTFPWGFGKGPMEVGQTVRFEIRLEEEPCYLRMRIVDRDGQALAGQEVSVQPLHSGYGVSTSITSDTKGFLQIPIEDRFAPVRSEGLSYLPPRSLMLTCAPRLGVRLAGLRQIGEDLKPGINHSEDLILGATLLAQGQVTDIHGVGIAGVQLRFQADPKKLDGALGSPAGISGLLTDAQGRFQLWNASGFEGILLKATRHPYRPGEARFRAGAAEVEIILRESSGHSIQVLLPEGANSDPVQLMFTRQGNAKHPTVLSTGPPADGSPMDLWHFPEGTYDIEVKLRGLQKPILELKDVHLSADALQDPRLKPLDLRPFLALGSVEVQGSRGSPIEEFRFGFEESNNSHNGISGEPILYVKESNRIEVWTSKTRRSTVPLSQTTQRVLLEPAFEIPVRIEASPILEEGASIMAYLTAADRSFHGGFPIDVQAPKPIHLSAPGTYRVTVNIVYQMESSGEQRRPVSLLLDGGNSLDFEVPVTGHPPPLILRLSQRQ